MAFNAANFRTQFYNSKWHRPAANNTFEVVFESVPKVLQGKLTAAEEKVFFGLRFRIQTADLPTRQFETQERRYAGPQRVMPFGLIYSTQQLELIEDESLTVRSIFDKWQSAVFNEENSYTIPYYDDVVTNFTLRVFNQQGALAKEFRFFEAYPISVQPSQMSWANNDSNIIVPVELAYREWRLT